MESGSGKLTERLLAQFESFADTGYEHIFVSSYSNAYAGFLQAITHLRLDGDSRVLDIGAGDGWVLVALDRLLAHRSPTDAKRHIASIPYVGVDPAQSAAAKISQQPGLDCLRALGIACFLADIHQPSVHAQITDWLKGEPNVIVCNAAIHQIMKYESSLDDVIAQLVRPAQPPCQILIGDYYYPDHCSDVEVEAARSWIRTTTGQTPSQRGVFIAPPVLETKMQSHGFRLVRSGECQANDEICLRYYWQLRERQT